MYRKTTNRACCDIINCEYYSARHICPVIHCAVLGAYNEDTNAWMRSREEYLEEMSDGNILAGI